MNVKGYNSIANVNFCQNKKRKFGRDHADERDGNEKRQPDIDPLEDATTLYVGNL